MLRALAASSTLQALAGIQLDLLAQAAPGSLALVETPLEDSV